MSALASTPYTPSSLAKKGKLIEADGTVHTMTVIALDKDMDLEATYDPDVSQHNSSGTRIRRGNSLDSSPNYTVHASKSKVRKSFEGLIRRLSGSRDSQIQQKMSNKQEELRVSPKPQRSPSACSFSSPLCEHNRRVVSQFDVNDDGYQGKPGTSSRRQRSLSADSAAIANTSLRRGRPNTVNSGLPFPPSPVNRQLSDPIGCRMPMNSSISIDPVDDNRFPTVAIDTSPIASKYETNYIKEDYDDMMPMHQLVHQVSKGSVGSFTADEASESTLDQAFIGSTLENDNIFTTSGIDLTGSDCTMDEHSISTCSTASDATDAAEGHILSTPTTQWRPVDPVERYIILPDRSTSHLLSSCNGSQSAPKIKPSLMPSNVTSRLLQKATCSPRVCTDSPVSSGRLVARSMFTDTQI